MIRITIEMNEQTGQVSVTGPITNKILCYGLLEAARENISSFTPDKQAMVKVADKVAERIISNGSLKP